MLSVVPSPTGRATCRLCEQRIAKGALRVDAKLGTAIGPVVEAYHVECVRALLPPREPVPP